MAKVVELVVGIALLGTGIGFAVAGVALFGLTAAATAIAVIGVGANLVLGGVVGMLQKPASLGGLTQQGNSISVKQPAAARVTIYGRDVVGGIYAYLATTGTNNEFMHLVLTFAGHEVDAIEEIYFDKYTLVLDGSGNEISQYNGFLSVEKKLGAAGEAAFPGLVTDTSGLGASAWTSACRQDGCCSIHFKLKWDQSKWPNGVPNIRAKIRGKKLLDPRTSTTAWSNNWALCVRDWMIDPVNGLKCVASEINDTVWNAAANLSDEAVSLAAGGTEPRYTCNGTYDTSKTRGTVIQAMLTAGAGRLAPCGGQWNLYGGAWRAPALALGDDDFRAGLQLTAKKSRRDLFSGVKGDFVDPTNDWQPQAFPPMVLASYVADDSGIVSTAERGRWLTATAYLVNDAVMSNGFAYVCTSSHTSGASTQPGVGASWQTKWQLASELNWKTVSYPFTTSAATAQRLAKIELEAGRRQMTLAAPVKLQGYLAQPPDVVQISSTPFSFVSKTFEIVECNLAPGGDGSWGVDFQLAETDANVYAWSTAFEQTQQPLVNVSVADPTVAQPPSGVTLASGAGTVLTRGDGIKLSRIQVTWTAPADQFVLSGGKIFCEYQVHNSGNWQPAFECDGATTVGFIQGVSDGVAYDVRLRSRNVHDIYSSFAQANNHTVGTVASNLTYRPLSNPLTANDAGSNDTIVIAGFTMRVGGNDIPITGNSLTGLLRKTLYFVKYTDPGLAGGAVTFTATTTKEDALFGNGFFFVGSILTPSAGGDATIGNNDGGVGTQSGNAFYLSPTLANDTVSADGRLVPIRNSNGLGDDADRDTTTSLLYNTAGTRIVAGFPSLLGNWTSLKLKVKTQVLSPGTQPMTVDYSIDNGITWTNLYTVAALGSRATTTDVVTLGLTQNPARVQVRYTTNAACNVLIYEAYIEGVN